MTSLAVLIPVKASAGKSRLSGLLSETKRNEFTRLMLTDVLGAVREAGLLRAAQVVSTDPKMLELAKRLGAHVSKEPGDNGVNSAVERGIAISGNPETVLVLPADLPLVRASELEHILARRSSGFDVVVTPSVSFNGTNALAFSGASHLDLSYDDNSFWNHIANASRRGDSVCVSAEYGMMFDIDSPEDFRVLARSKANKPSVRFARGALR